MGARNGGAHVRTINAIYWLALTIWVGVLIAAGTAAVSAFTVLPDPDLGVHLERFDAFDHAQHGRIAAGHVMEPIFTFVDLVQVVAAVIVAATLMLQLTLFRMSVRRPAHFIRALCIGIAAGMLLGRAVLWTPQMNADLRAYWQAAEIGDADAAALHYEAFSVQHRGASRMLNGSLFVLLIAVMASAAAMTPTAQRKIALETPRLLRR
jgi:hypothetical protein